MAEVEQKPYAHQDYPKHQYRAIRAEDGLSETETEFNIPNAAADKALGPAFCDSPAEAQEYLENLEASQKRGVKAAADKAK